MDKKLWKNTPATLQKQLSFILIEEIISNDHQPGTKFYTEREISKKYDTSTITVKLAIKDLIEKGILYQLPRSGTFIKNNNIAYKHEENSLYKHNIICISDFNKSSASTNPFYSVIFKNLEYELETNGYILEFYSVSDYNYKKEVSLFMKIAQNQVGGVILMGSLLSENIVNKIIETGIPSVIVNRDEIRNKDISNIVIDNINGAFKAVDYLVKMGHKEIAFIGGNLINKASSLRLKGYEKALKFHNIKIDKNLIINNGFNMCPRDGSNNLNILWRENNKLPSAIFAASDDMAIGCISFMRNSDIQIPQDVSLIGFNDIEMASHIHPALTTMHVDRKKMAQMASKRIMDLLQNKKHNKKQIIIDPVLIERESVKRIEI